MNNRLFKKNKDKRCCYCRHGSFSTDKQHVMCPKRGVMDRDDKCYFFSYDATKREPMIPAPMQEYSDDVFEL